MVTRSEVQDIASRIAVKMLRSVRGQVRGLVRRATLGSIAGGSGQTIQANSTADDQDDEIELFESYGFTSSPPQGSEGIVLRVGGERANSVALCFGSRGDRFSDLAAGEVAVYNTSGCSIVLRANGNIEVTPGEGGVVQLGGPTATLAVARETDFVNAGSLMSTWAGVVETAINGLAPGSFTPLNSFATVTATPGEFGSIAERANEGATCT